MESQESQSEKSSIQALQLGGDGSATKSSSKLDLSPHLNLDLNLNFDANLDLEQNSPSENSTSPKEPNAMLAPSPSPPKAAPPEGGLKGWLAVLACWCIMFNTFGYINAFGIFEAYYKSTMLPHESESNIAWIGSIQVFFMFSAGLISGPLMDRYGPKPILIPCSVVFILSMMLTSLCREYYQFILAQGVLGGLANGLTYTPALTAVGHYFSKKRPLAMGIASSGASISGITLPIALNRLLNRSTVGFGWSVRVLGFVMLVLSIIACLTVSSSAPKRRIGPPLVLTAWRNPAYSLQVVGTFLVMWAVFVPFFYLPGFAQSIGLTVDLSFYLLAILNAASLFGRLLGGATAGRLGRINTLSLGCMICGILILCWLPIRSQGAIITFTALFGFFSGTVIAVFPATIAMTAPQPNEIGSYLGMALGVYSLAGLSGTPITGAMINNYSSYDPAITFAGVSALVGAAVIFASRYYVKGTNLVV